MQGNSSKPAAQQQAQPGTQPAAPHAQPQAQGLTVRVIDRPECQEIFADSVTGLYFDGQTLRMEMSVTRLRRREAEHHDNGPALTRLPACPFSRRGRGADQSHTADCLRLKRSDYSASERSRR